MIRITDEFHLAEDGKYLGKEKPKKDKAPYPQGG